MKRAIAILLVITLLTGTVVMTAGAQECTRPVLTTAVSDGYCRPYPEATYELTYRELSDGTLEITGFRGDPSKNLLIPDNILGKSVTVIGSDAFIDCSSFTGNLTIPDSITSIEGSAFGRCTGFDGKLTLGKNVTEIGPCAFFGCSGFTGNLTIPDGVTSIYFGVFAQCAGFNGILTLGKNVTFIDDCAFLGCSGLAGRVTIPAGVTSIGGSAFWGCGGITGVCFLGNAPDLLSPEYEEEIEVFDKGMPLYYLKNATGWTDSPYYDAKTGTWNGYPLKIWEKDIFDGVYGSQYKWREKWFTGGQNQYRHDLAIASLNLAVSAFNSEDAPAKGYAAETAGRHIRNQLCTLGFEEDKIDISSYGGKPDGVSVAAAIGVKKVQFGGETGRLLVIVVRGGGYEAEWGNNFVVGSKGNHLGFQGACNQVLVQLKSFLQQDQNRLPGRTAVWVTGYSRGAATANLVSGSLLKPDMQKKVGLSIDKNDLYAYTFATPMGLVGGSPRNTPVYNIINPIDVVPKVAPVYWGFSRYGKDMILPCYSIGKRESTYNQFLENYKQFSGSPLPKPFTPYRIMINNHSIQVTKDTRAFKKNHSLYLDRIVNVALAQQLASSRQEYAEKLQTTLSNVIEKLNSGEFKFDMEKLDKDVGTDLLAAAAEVLERRGTIRKAGRPGIAINWLNKLSGYDRISLCQKLAEILVAHGVVKGNSEELGYWLSEILDTEGILKTALLNIDNIATGIINARWFAVCHKPQFYLAAMHAIADNPDTAFGRGSNYQAIRVNCPVDVRLYDSNNQLAGAIVNDQAQEIPDSPVLAGLDDNGQKIFILPGDQEYRTETTASGAGDINYSVTEYGHNGAERTVSYYDIPMTAGQVCTGTVDSLTEPVRNYDLKDTAGQTIREKEELAEESIVYYTVTPGVEGYGFVQGGGSFQKGEFVLMGAVPDEGEQFLGWYENGKLLSGEMNYRMKVTENHTITGKFTTLFEHDYQGDNSHETADILEAGDEVIIVNKNYGVAVSCEDKDQYYRNAVPISTNVEAIYDPPESILWTVGKGEKGITFTSRDGRMLSLDGVHCALGLGLEHNEWTVEKAKSEDRYVIRNVTAGAEDENGLMHPDMYLCYGDAQKDPVGKPADHWSGCYKIIPGKEDVFELTFYIKAKSEDPPAVEMPFQDVRESDWFYDSVKFVYEYGLMNGTSAFGFEPEASTTRAMLVTVLHRMEGAPAPQQALKFVDVASGQWYSDAIAWASEHDIVNGIGENRFAPEENVTREQMVTILHRYAAYKNYDTEIGTLLAEYVDHNEVHSWAFGAMRWAVGAKLIQGKNGLWLAPRDNASRAEIATILKRFCVVIIR